MTGWILFIALWGAPLALVLWDTREKRPIAAVPTGERGRFLRRHDGFDVVNLAVLASTFFAAAIAAYEAARLADLTDQLVRDGQASSIQQAEFTRESNRINREALIASSRAWVGPIDAKISGSVELGKPVKIMVSVRNTGKEPARNFRWVPSHLVSADIEILSQKVNTSLAFCFGTPSTKFGQVVYPSSGFGSGFDFQIDLPKEDIDEDVLSGKNILVALGCIAYETSGVTRHSAFCYYYRSGASSPEHLNICDGGSSAD